ncbi:hypothetical protein EXU48_07510 [Occultella glacieicola]|uniref:Uncharacterized protein n=1 Tax=Occultella glacieicola TaxID=2518684 RepID=A0ABY2E660_9MICO|nr:hypothetical protein [Occultella glacieicola]TDE96074.1 hypothetical protein EXU48_07510 [Occultella glacieicola]
MILRYQRGHEMSGYLRLAVDADGTAEATSSGRGDLDRRSGSGTLTSEQGRRLGDAVDRAGLRELTGSTRNIGDDEVPIVVSVDSREVLLWAEDAAAVPGFGEFESTVRDLVDVLLAGSAEDDDGAPAAQ